MMNAIGSSKTLVLTRATRRYNPEGDVLFLQRFQRTTQRPIQENEILKHVSFFEIWRLQL
jgi:hypothetical protein